MTTTPAEAVWLKRMADIEDEGTIGVGGWVMALEDSEGPPEGIRNSLSAFSKLVQLTRREKVLTRDEFSAKIDIPLAELVRVEREPDYTPTAQVIGKIARFLGVPESELVVLLEASPISPEGREAPYEATVRSFPGSPAARGEREALAPLSGN